MKIYHNPRCSKSRQALAACRESGLEPEVVEYLKTPLTLGQLTALWEGLGRDLEAMSRMSDLKKAGLTPSLQLLAAEPVYLQRPILVDGDRVAVCRSPEDLKAFLK